MTAGLESFHPALAAWFINEIGQPTATQLQAWEAIRADSDTLIEAPTGSGKTLAAFYSILDKLTREAEQGTLEDSLYCLYVSPLRALSHDIAHNLQRPLQGIQSLLPEGSQSAIRALVRTGDTPQAERSKMIRQPPHILVTTPESLYLLLTSASGRTLLSCVRWAIIDEVHAMAPNKRGSHLVLSLQRLQKLCGHHLTRIGLSATQRPLERVADFLFVSQEGQPPCIISAGFQRQTEAQLEMPHAPLSAIISEDQWVDIHERLTELIESATKTLIFVNNRRLCERLARALSDKLGSESVAAHHGSLSRELRLDAEARMRSGTVRVIVATASLELGIDIGDIDLVCQLGSTHKVSIALQRIGRSGRGFGAIPRGHIFPLTADEAVECAALLRCMQQGHIDPLLIPAGPVDVLAQQIVAEVAAESVTAEQLYRLFTATSSYSKLKRQDFDALVNTLTSPVDGKQGRRESLLMHDRTNGQLRARKGSRLRAMLNAGSIPDQFDYDVVLQPQGDFLGTVNEDFAIESMAGDLLQLGNAAYVIERVEQARLIVHAIDSEFANLPFWLGDAPARSHLLTEAVSELRETVAQVYRNAESKGLGESACEERVMQHLCEHWFLQHEIAAEIASYLIKGLRILGVMPTIKRIVAERFFDETGETHWVLHTPYGSRLNRAWGLALRKKFCRRFNFELQAVALDEGLMLSLGATHSFPVTEPLSYLQASSLRSTLTQAVLATPMFATQWRWNASTALAVSRRNTRGRTPAPVQRAQAEDLLALVFPDQLACLENIVGEREVPDHPIVHQTLIDCLDERMDCDALEGVLNALSAGEIEVIGMDTPAPSVFAEGLLSARPYAYLDDAPLEERRARAVQRAPRNQLIPARPIEQIYIQQLRDSSQPQLEGPADLLDRLDWLRVLDRQLAQQWATGALSLDSLIERKLMDVLPIGNSNNSGSSRKWLLSPDMTPNLRAAMSGGGSGKGAKASQALEDEASQEVTEMLRAWLCLEIALNAEDWADRFNIPRPAVELALTQLESEGFALRGVKLEGDSRSFWCAKHLFARLQKYQRTQRRAAQISAPIATYRRFLLLWQAVFDKDGQQGADLLHALSILHGWPAPAVEWERSILPLRAHSYQSRDLDMLCLSGSACWRTATFDKTTGKASDNPDNSKDSQTADSADDSNRPLRGASLRTPLTFLRLDEGDRFPLPFANPQKGRLGSRTQRLTSWMEEQENLFASNIFAPPTQPGAPGMLPLDVRHAMRQLLACGQLRSDAFDAVRYLLRLPDWAGQPARIAGRFYLSLPAHEQPAQMADKDPREREKEVRRWVHLWLRRWGILYRALIRRESRLNTATPSWKEVLQVLHRMEDSGELEGGRFIDSNLGEQFALPEAATALRSLHKQGGTPLPAVVISACDPLNIGALLGSERVVPAKPGYYLLLVDGQPLASFYKGEIVPLGTEPVPDNALELIYANIRGNSRGAEQGEGKSWRSKIRKRNMSLKDSMRYSRRIPPTRL